MAEHTGAIAWRYARTVRPQQQLVIVEGTGATQYTVLANPLRSVVIDSRTVCTTITVHSSKTQQTANVRRVQWNCCSTDVVQDVTLQYAPAQHATTSSGSKTAQNRVVERGTIAVVQEETAQSQSNPAQTMCDQQGKSVS